MDLAAVRRMYARQMLAAADACEDVRLEDAFAAVARERFLGQGQGHISTPWSPSVPLPRRDPILIYQDVVVALDRDRGVNNGSPSLHAHWMHRIAPRGGETVAHIGAGAGYYTALLSELVGKAGHVTAVEFDAGLAARASANLCDRGNVACVCGDGRDWPREPADIVYVNFAISKPAPAWVDRLPRRAVDLPAWRAASKSSCRRAARDASGRRDGDARRRALHGARARPRLLRLCGRHEIGCVASRCSHAGPELGGQGLGGRQEPRVAGVPGCGAMLVCERGLGIELR